MAIRSPEYVFEKSRRNLPRCFLFGRRSTGQRDTDVWLGVDRSLSRTEFTIGIKNGCWVIRSLGSSFEVHGDTPVERNMPGLALHLHVGNHIDLKASPSLTVSFEIYCRPPNRATFLLQYTDTSSALQDGHASISSASSMSTFEPHESPERLYLFKHHAIESRTDIAKILSLDPWTCTFYVAKIYPVPQFLQLQHRIDLLNRLPVSDTPFVSLASPDFVLGI